MCIQNFILIFSLICCSFVKNNQSAGSNPHDSFMDSLRATLLHTPGRDAPSGSARSCWGPTGWADWACLGLARSWNWTWACEPGGNGAPSLAENHRRRSSWDETTKPGPEPAGLERSWRRRSHRRVWRSRSPPLSVTDLIHCCEFESDRAAVLVKAALTAAQI